MTENFLSDKTTRKFRGFRVAAADSIAAAIIIRLITAHGCSDVKSENHGISS